MTPPELDQTRAPASLVAVISGGSRGLGRALVLECARRGYDVVFSHRGRGTDAADTIELARALGTTVVGIEADVTVQLDVDRLAQAAIDQGPVHLLINNAGVLFENSLDATTEFAWNRSIAVHATAPMRLARALSRSLADTSGAILNVACDGGVVGSPYGAAHGASKAAMIGLSKTLARELAPRVRVNSIAPGPVDTDMWRSMSDGMQRRIESETPLNRVATAAEIAIACLDICSWKCVTGQTLVVDGGRVMQ